MDYRSVTIPDNSVIYCDIPYLGTNPYTGKGNNFNHDQFYQWCQKQRQPLFISSYDMPRSMFVCVLEMNHLTTLSATANGKKVTERIFVPRHQFLTNKYPTVQKQPQQLSLFG